MIDLGLVPLKSARHPEPHARSEDWRLSCCCNGWRCRGWNRKVSGCQHLRHPHDPTFRSAPPRWNHRRRMACGSNPPSHPRPVRRTACYSVTANAKPTNSPIRASRWRCCSCSFTKTALRARWPTAPSITDGIHHRRTAGSNQQSTKPMPRFATSFNYWRPREIVEVFLFTIEEISTYSK